MSSPYITPVVKGGSVCATTKLCLVGVVVAIIVVIYYYRNPECYAKTKDYLSSLWTKARDAVSSSKEKERFATYNRDSGLQRMMTEVSQPGQTYKF